MIRQRVRAGLSVIKEKIARDGKFVSKAGKVRRKLGCPGAEPDKIELARRELAKGLGIGKVAREVGLELSPAQPCRALLQQAQAVPPHRHPIRQARSHFLRLHPACRHPHFLAIN